MFLISFRASSRAKTGRVVWNCCPFPASFPDSKTTVKFGILDRLSPTSIKGRVFPGPLSGSSHKKINQLSDSLTLSANRLPTSLSVIGLVIAPYAVMRPNQEKSGSACTSPLNFSLSACSSALSPPIEMKTTRLGRSRLAVGEPWVVAEATRACTAAVAARVTPLRSASDPSPVGALVLAPVGGSVLAPVGGSVLASVGGSGLAPIGGSILASVGASVLAPIGGSVLASVGASVLAPVGGSELAPFGVSGLASIGGSGLASVGASVGTSVTAMDPPLGAALDPGLTTALDAALGSPLSGAALDDAALGSALSFALDDAVLGSALSPPLDAALGSPLSGAALDDAALGSALSFALDDAVLGSALSPPLDAAFPFRGVSFFDDLSGFLGIVASVSLS